MMLAVAIALASPEMSIRQIGAQLPRGLETPAGSPASAAKARRRCAGLSLSIPLSQPRNSPLSKHASSNQRPSS